MERVQGKCTDPSGVVCDTQVYCWPCHLAHARTASGGTYVCDPLFPTTKWGFQPKCYKCQENLEVTVKTNPIPFHRRGYLNFNLTTFQPKFALKPGTAVGHIRLKELGEIIRWAFGPHANSYSYEVRCAEDGAIKIWHRSDISVNPESMRWK